MFGDEVVQKPKKLIERQPSARKRGPRCHAEDMVTLLASPLSSCSYEVVFVFHSALWARYGFNAPPLEHAVHFPGLLLGEARNFLDREISKLLASAEMLRHPKSPADGCMQPAIEAH